MISQGGVITYGGPSMNGKDGMTPYQFVMTRASKELWEEELSAFVAHRADLLEKFPYTQERFQELCDANDRSPLKGDKRVLLAAYSRINDAKTRPVPEYDLREYEGLYRKQGKVAGLSMKERSRFITLRYQYLMDVGLSHIAKTHEERRTFSPEFQRPAMELGELVTGYPFPNDRPEKIKARIRELERECDERLKEFFFPFG